MVLAPSYDPLMVPQTQPWEDDEDAEEEYAPEFCDNHKIETDCYGHIACLTCRRTK